MIPAAAGQPPAPLRLDANEPADSGLDLAALVASAAGTLHRYPAAVSRLTDAIAARHAVPADRVLLGAGSADLITLAWRVCTGPGRTAAFGTPGFELYALLCRQFRLPASTWPVATPSDVLPGAAVFDGPAPGLVAVSNPHNPTGSRVPRTAVAQLADRLPTGTVLLNDEAYAEYVEDEPGDMTFAELSGRPNVISTRTFSKLYGLPALRVGYAVAEPALIRRLAALRTPHMVSQLGALGALQALGDDAAVAARRQRTASCRRRLRVELLRRGFTVPDACANFLLAQRDDDIDWATRLAGHGVLVKAVGPAIRITVPALADLDRLLGALDAVSRGKACCT
jgi:histidinol-phosphate aminotransferase